MRKAFLSLLKLINLLKGLKKKLCKSLVHMNVLHILFLEIKLFIYHMVRNLIPPVKTSSKSGIRDKGYHYVTDDRCYTKLMYRVSSS